MELKDIEPFNLDCLLMILNLYKQDIGDANPQVFIRQDYDCGDYFRIKGIDIDEDGDMIIEFKEV